MEGGEAGEMSVKLFVRFRPLCLRYLQWATIPLKTSNFGDTSKPLIVNHLNFIDTYCNPKTGLKRPERA